MKRTIRPYLQNRTTIPAAKAAIVRLILTLTALLMLSGCGSGGISGNNAGDSGNMTLMVYMIGSDLESINGCASQDIREMIDAHPGEHVRIILETGGADQWMAHDISNRKLQRWEVTGEGLTLLEEMDSARMSDADTLADFLQWGNERYPAERTGVILWNHGGGSALGYGHDELFPEGMLTLPGIRRAFQKAGGHYAFIGFDACLMSTLETGCMLSEFADYLIASEETEPGDGWFYTDWLKKLNKDPGLTTEKLGKAITKDFIAQSRTHPYDTYTLAMIRLDKVQDLMEKLTEFFEESAARIQAGEYRTFAAARVRSTSFGSGHYEQIDVGDYLELIDPDGKFGLEKALKNCIVCFETSLKRTCGLAMYYPYQNLNLYTKMMRNLSEIGYPGRYFDFFNSFCSVLSIADSENPEGAQATSGKAGAAIEKEDHSSVGIPASQYTVHPWYRDDIVKQYYPEASLSSHEASLVRFGEDVFDSFYWLELPEGVEWENIWYREDRFLLDDGEKLLNIGTQAHQDLYREDHDFIVYDPVWFCIGTTVVPSFFQYFEEREDGLMNAVHYIPAVLNDAKSVQIAVQEDAATWNVNVLGYFDEQVQAEYDGIKVPPKAYSQFSPEDVLRFPVDCYDYDYRYLGTELLDGEETAGENGLEVRMGYMGNRPARLSCVLRDVYNNYISTPWVEHQRTETAGRLNLQADDTSWVAGAAPGNDPDVPGLPYGFGMCYGFKLRNESPGEIRSVYLKRADYPEEAYQDILYEPIPAGKSAVYADIEHYINWDCTAWSMKVCGADGQVNQSEIVFNPWVAKEIVISWDDVNQDYSSTVTYSREGSYQMDIAAYRNGTFNGWNVWEEVAADLSDSLTFLQKFPPWHYTIENRGNDVITHMYMSATDKEITEKEKEIYDSFRLDDFGGNDMITELILPGATVESLSPVIYDASHPIWAFAVTENDTDIREAVPVVPYPVWNVLFEDLSGNRSMAAEFRPWETTGIVIKETAGDGDSAYECEFQP